MQKKFISNLIFLVLINLLVKPFFIFGIDAAIQNRVQADYGLYFSLINLSFLFNILLDLGINNFTTKNISQYPHIVTRYMGKLLSFRLFLFVIYASITLLVAFFGGYNQKAIQILLFLIFNQLLATLIAYFRSHFAGLMLFKTEAFISVLDRILLIAFCGTALLYIPKSQSFAIEWFVWLQTFCYGITAIIAFFILVRHIGLPQISWHWTFSKAIVKKSFPYALLILLMMIYTRSDSILLERIHENGSEQAGIYAQGFRLLDAFFIFGMLFSNLLFPLFSRLFKLKETILPLLQTSANLLIGGAVVIVAFCYFNGEWILSLIYDHNIDQSLTSFRWLMLSFVGMCFSLVFGTLLTAHGSLRLLNQFSFVAILINIGLNLLLIPRYGAVGAAFTAFCTQSFIAIIQLFYSAKLFQFSFAPSAIIHYGFFIITIVGIFMVFQWVKLDHYEMILELFLALITLFAFKMIDVRALRLQFKSNS